MVTKILAKAMRDRRLPKKVGNHFRAVNIHIVGDVVSEVDGALQEDKGLFQSDLEGC